MVRSPVPIPGLEHEVDYERLVRLLAELPDGQKIVRGEVRDYDPWLFEQDLQLALHESGLTYARLDVLKQLAERASLNGTYANLNRAIATACEYLLAVYSPRRR